MRGETDGEREGRRAAGRREKRERAEQETLGARRIKLETKLTWLQGHKAELETEAQLAVMYQQRLEAELEGQMLIPVTEEVAAHLAARRQGKESMTAIASGLELVQARLTEVEADIETLERWMEEEAAPAEAEEREEKQQPEAPEAAAHGGGKRRRVAGGVAAVLVLGGGAGLAGWHWSSLGPLLTRLGGHWTNLTASRLGLLA